MAVGDVFRTQVRRGLWVAGWLAILGMLAAGASLQAQDGCFADCADGLAPVDDLGPIPGVQAPEVTLRVLDAGPGADGPIALQELVREKPVVLAFGSYT